MVVGLDTSCYTTSAAVVSDSGDVLASERRLLPVEAGERGLRQSEALFAHVKQLPELIQNALNAGYAQGERVRAVCASSRPRDDQSSYMPVFLAGVLAGRAMASAAHVPYFECAHQMGHVLAAAHGLSLPEDYVAAHVSGGTTEVLSVRSGALTLLGGSDDLHAGQLVDRVGVRMGLRFPSGPELERLAVLAKPTGAIPASVRGAACSFSGAQSAAERLLDGGMPREQVAAEVYDVLARTLSRLLAEACARCGARAALVAGGVASSALLRTLLAARLRKRAPQITLCFGRPEYSGDNAVGAALFGFKRSNA